MSRLVRYWHLLRTLPAEERRVRAGRLTERLLRGRPGIRRLGLAPDPPRWRRFRKVLSVSPTELAMRLRRTDERRGPLFDDLDTRVEALAAERPGHGESVLAAATRILDRRYDLLGSGPSRPLGPDGLPDWHLDWKSGGRWNADTYYTELTVVRGDGSDVKVPWELARCQHLLVLGQAYHLAPHLMDAAEAREFAGRCALEVRAQVDHWIHDNPRGLGVHWTCTMEVGIRAFVWIACLALLRRAPEFDNTFIARIARALWVHGRHVRANLEIGSDGLKSNHYLSDLIGLYQIACALPELHESRTWSAFCRESLIREIEDQVHPDGVDFERSIPYHRLVLEIFLHGALLARGRGEDLPADYVERLEAMLEFSACYTRLDGSVPQWGDNDDGRLLPLDGYATHRPNDHRHVLALGASLLGREDLARVAGGRDIEARWLFDRVVSDNASVAPAGRTSRGYTDAGFYVLRSADLHAAVPCGAVGTRGEGNHSHNDLLSLSLWAGGVEWIADPGSGCYTGDPDLRNRLRSTSAHSTLQLGEREQNRPGPGLDGLFRMEERARPEVTDWRVDATGARVTARHRGFSGDDGEWIHERSVGLRATSRTYRLEDRLTREPAGGPAPAEPIRIRLVLGPAVRAEPVGDAAAWPALIDRELQVQAETEHCRVWRLWAGDAVLWVGFALPPGSRVESAEAIYSPRYGVSLPGRTIVATLPPAVSVSATTLLWSPGPDDAS